MMKTKLDQEELLSDILSSRVVSIGHIGKSYIKRFPDGEGYVYRIDLFDKERGWYHSEWYNPEGYPIRSEYYGN